VSLAHVRMGGHVAFLEKGVGVFGPCWTDKVLGEFLASTLVPRSAAARAVDKALPPVNPTNKDRISRSVFGAQYKNGAGAGAGGKSALLKQGGVGSFGALGEDGRARL